MSKIRKSPGTMDQVPSFTPKKDMDQTDQEFAQQMYDRQKEQEEKQKEQLRKEFGEEASEVTGGEFDIRFGKGTYVDPLGDDFMTALGQSIGLKPGENIQSFLMGDRPESVRDLYKDVQTSLEEQAKGFSTTEMESVVGSKRRELAEQARRAGAGTKALKGGQRLEAAKKAQMGDLMQQAAQMQAGQEASRARAEAGKAGLAKLEMDIVTQDRERQMEFDAQQGNIALQMFNLAEQRRIGDELRKAALGIQDNP